MAQVVYSDGALCDLERMFRFLAVADPPAAQAGAEAIVEAVNVLRGHPLIGRPIDRDLRELVISRGKSGYIALYRYLPNANVVRVLALKHQREAGYTE